MQKIRIIISSAIAAALLAGTINAVAMSSTPAFSDVPSTHWAYGSIQTMADMGIVSGVGGGRFAPNSKVSAAQFATMVTRAFPADEQEGLPCKTDKTNNASYVKKQNEDTMNPAMTRAATASILIDFMDQQGVDIPSAVELDAARAKIADYDCINAKYQDAVAIAYHRGLLKMVDAKGSFNPNGKLTRAEACVVLARMMRQMEEREASEAEASQLVELSEANVPKDESPAEEVYLANGAPITEDNIKSILERLREKYPAGMAWGWREKLGIIKKDNS